jgi:predicted RND superfamily exporter protein
VARHPFLTLTACLALVAGCAVLTASRLELLSDRSRLIDPHQPWNLRYGEYKVNFPHDQDLVVVIDGPPGDPGIDELARSIADRLRADPRVQSADAGFDVAEAGPRFFRSALPAQFDAALADIARGRELSAAENANAALGLLLEQVRRGEGDPGALDRLETFLGPYLAAAGGREPDFSFMSPRQHRWQPLVSREGLGRLRFVLVQPRSQESGVSTLDSTLAWIRATAAQVVAASQRPQSDWGVTGIAAIEADESRQAFADSTIASALAMGLITLLMFLVFRGLVVPLLAALSLLIGMAWCFGWLTLAVGHLQLLSAVFSPILLGLGIDYALLYVSRLELVRDEHGDLASATARVYRRIGPGMITGAVTTASAFAATALTKFTGMAEMGTIAAGGLILCLVAVLSAFPAMLALTGRHWKRIVRHRPGGEQAHFARGRLDFVDEHPVATLVVASALVAFLGVLALRVSYDPNVLNLQARNVESVQWEKRIIDEDARSVWTAVVTCTPKPAPELVRRLRDAEGVSDVGGMGLLFPRDLDRRLAAIETVRERPVAPQPADATLDTTLMQLAAVQAGIGARMRGTPADVRERLTGITRAIGDALRTASKMSAAEKARAWEALDASFIAARAGLAAWIDEALLPVAPGEEDLPPLLRDWWVGRDGSWLLVAYPVADPTRSVLHPERLGPFVASVEASVADMGVSPIGPAVQIYRSSELIQAEYIKAACYAIAAILVLLLLDFRSLADALCAISPVVVGFIGAFGVMGATGVPLNFANIMILPLIFGIGVSAGVNVVHRWRLEPFGRPRGLGGATGRGITLTVLTSMIGFGGLLVAEHRGIRSLGFVMTVGLGMTLPACYTVLPAILKLRAQASAVAARERRGGGNAAATRRPRRLRGIRAVAGHRRRAN